MILLSGTDKKLPQIGRMRDLLTRGIGIHHGGLLPIVKEVGTISFMCQHLYAEFISSAGRNSVCPRTGQDIVCY